MPAKQTLSSLGEFGFLHRLFPRLRTRSDVLVGPGDDCAVVRRSRRNLLITTDALVEGVHFEREWLTPRQLGRRSLLVNLSDIAAMGGGPTHGVISLGVPPRYRLADLVALHDGIAAVARETGSDIVGGNVTRARQAFVSITLLGEVDRPVLRNGARAGDQLFVSGVLGEAALGVRQLRRGKRRGPAITRYREPQPRLQAGALLAQERMASAMIDVSDGLLQDLRHIVESSGVGAVIDVDALPHAPGLKQLRDADALQLALCGGDDYELLFTVPRRKLARLEKLRPKLGCQVTRIGECTKDGRGIRLRGAGRAVRIAGEGGWDHLVGW
jgi:thiamine-monophosphate kinase